MKTTPERKLLSILIVSMFVIGFCGIKGKFQLENPRPSEENIINVVPKILIDGNGALFLFPNKTGSGTLNDPYLISEMAINSSGGGSAIEIRNTDKHLILQKISSAYDTDGVKLINCSNITIYDCRFQHNVDGIDIFNCSDCVIDSNYVEGNSYGISIVQNSWSSNLTICNNEFYGSLSKGVYFEGNGLNSTISHNEFFANYGSINTESANNLSICFNEIISETGSGMYLSNSDHMAVFGNEASGSNDYYGITLFYVSYSTIFNNSLFDNYGGISVEGAVETVISQNRISTSTMGINLLHTTNNIIYKNRFSDVETKIVEIECVGNEITRFRIFEIWELTLIWSSIGLVLITIVILAVIMYKKKKSSKELKKVEVIEKPQISPKKFYCQHCGYYVLDKNIKHCEYCGLEISSISNVKQLSNVTQSHNNANLCSNCGNILHNSQGIQKYCNFCGYKPS